MSILSFHTSISNLTWDVVYSTIQAEFSRQTNSANVVHYSSIPYSNKLS